MEKIKVCNIITKLELGGAQQVALHIISYIDKEKFIPVLIAGKGGILDSEAAELKGVKIFLLGSLIRQIRPCKDILGFFSIIRILMKERPHIVHTHSSKAGIIGRWAAFFAGVPVRVHTVHGYGFNDSQKGIVRSILVLAEKVTAKITHKLIVVTREDEAKGLRHGIGVKSQYVLIRAGIDVEFYKNVRIDKDKKKAAMAVEPGKKIVTTIGPLKPQKNIKDFVRVADAVSRRYAECSFVIVGDGEQRKEIEFLIFALGLNEKVKLLGWRKDIPEILAASDIFVLTSLWEGLPRTILEAMCLKLPVVANAVDGVREVIKNGANGFLVEPFDTDRMADIITALLKDPETSRTLGQNGFDSVTEEFDLRYMLKEYEDLYINTAGGKFGNLS